ncbi:pentapeptide repeat-containing protein [Streptomyces sp. NPDC091217]|uniref:pentapeptide repeat-containing protein n=1 Tax=Streptomyces sp. NPDC091217 TaxID=3365975 RepID=UPI00380EB3B0
MLAFTAAVAAATAAFYAGWELLHVQRLAPEHHIGSKTLFDLVKLSFGVVAGAGALVALVMAYRRQRVDEEGAQREATRLHNERFTSAVDQFGNESEAVRLGAVHALAGLADDAPTRELRQTCIDVLCAHLRLPYTVAAPTDDAQTWHTFLAQKEVRHTIIRLIRDHLRLAAKSPHSWQGHDFDFTGVVFDGGDFSGAKFSGGAVRFDAATFCAHLVNFRDTEFSDGNVSFVAARFTHGFVNFGRATFSGSTVSFDFANFKGSTVSFARAQFNRGVVTFNRTKFTGRVGRVSFAHAQFIGGKVIFNWAKFARYSVNFRGATFSGGTVDLARAKGKPPVFLIPRRGRPLPKGLTLPPKWRY